MMKRTPRAGSAFVIFILAYCVIYAGVHALSVFLGTLLEPQSDQEKITLTLATSVLLLWTELLLMLAVLRLRGQSFADIGWRKPASLAGWLSAAGLAIAYSGMMLAGPLRNAPYLSDWSLFRIATALGAGISAGICEEAIFRGFVMTQARTAGLPVVAQILVSAILFGLAHVGWASLTAHFNLAAFMGSVGTTSMLGALFGIVYVVGRRSLMPVMFAHGAVDLVIEPWLMLYALSGGFNHFGH